ncbi:dihydroxyacetone kinase subunit DhaL [Nonomuraea soli]|uniref:Dihydroxyacetone kinase-like protein n=1 Tax=Nonomuraea soli TaxID=1032476 RepID=A0A7W0CEY8_9ACTN|nr:dihydroxyacetone kinase subunit DhaL [Nonomuraea soli]MBA2889908.1 dihydroxyacetone kinase-like protein [Nonomuraea soli]
MAAGAWLKECARVVAAERERLTGLDAAIGDADHGANLDRGFQAIVAELDLGDEAEPGAQLVAAGSLLIRRVGGASGPLYGSALRSMGKALSQGADLSTALEQAVEAVEKLGKAVEGDKTMVDALRPAANAMALAVQEGIGVREALDRAARAAEEGAAATTPMRARKGRASYLGERSEGHRDPGATSAALLIRALAATW